MSMLARYRCRHSARNHRKPGGSIPIFCPFWGLGSFLSAKNIFFLACGNQLPRDNLQAISVRMRTFNLWLAWLSSWRSGGFATDFCELIKGGAVLPNDADAARNFTSTWLGRKSQTAPTCKGSIVCSIVGCWHQDT